MNNLPPHDRSAELALLGGILRDPDVLPAVRAIVSSESFYFDHHGRIFAALVSLADAASPIDLATVAGFLETRREMENIGGVEYLAELFQAEPTGAQAEYHARAVQDRATVRAVIYTANVILRDAQDGAMPAEELLATAERSIFALAENHQQARDTVRHVKDIVREVMNEIDRRSEQGNGLAGVPSGYVDVDELLGGLRPGEMVVIGARPSVGKTALALNMATRAAAEGVPVFFASLEMPARELGGRLLSMGSGVPMQRITRGLGLSADEAYRITSAASPDGIGGSPIYVDDTADQLPARIAATCRRLVRRNRIGLAVVDYLQLMRPENQRENRTQQVGMMALRMKHMARDCGIPVILLSQLNREMEHSARKPRLSDLRESGDIEAHADRVILLHRDSALEQSDPAWPIDVIVAKNRNGPTGDVRLLYQRPAMRFENMARGL